MGHLVPSTKEIFFSLFVFLILRNGIALPLFCRTEDSTETSESYKIRCDDLFSYTQFYFVVWSTSERDIAICYTTYCTDSICITCISFERDYKASVCKSRGPCFFLEVNRHSPQSDSGRKYYISNNGGTKTLAWITKDTKPQGNASITTTMNKPLLYQSTSTNGNIASTGTVFDEKVSVSYETSTRLTFTGSIRQSVKPSEASDSPENRQYSLTFLPENENGHTNSKVINQEDTTVIAEQLDDNTPGLKTTILKTFLTSALVVITGMAIYIVHVQIQNQRQRHQLQTSLMVEGGHQEIQLGSISAHAQETSGSNATTRLNNLDHMMGDRVDSSDSCDISSNSCPRHMLPPIPHPSPSDMSSEGRCLQYAESTLKAPDLDRRRPSLREKNRKCRTTGDKCYEDINDVKKSMGKLYARPSKRNTFSPNHQKSDDLMDEAYSDSFAYAELQEVHPNEVRMSEDKVTSRLVGTKNINPPIFSQFLNRQKLFVFAVSGPGVCKIMAGNISKITPYASQYASSSTITSTSIDNSSIAIPKTQYESFSSSVEIDAAISSVTSRPLAHLNDNLTGDYNHLERPHCELQPPPEGHKCEMSLSFCMVPPPNTDIEEMHPGSFLENSTPVMDASMETHGFYGNAF